jgi:hypothetical protein
MFLNCCLPGCSRSCLLLRFFRKRDCLAVWTAFSSVTGQAFIANMGSVYAGSGMLINLFREGRIYRSNLILSVIFAAFPAHLRLLLTSIGPVVFSLFTFPVALFYVSFSMVIALLKLVIAGGLSIFLLPKTSLPEYEKNTSPSEPAMVSKANGDAFKSALKKTLYFARRTTVFVSLVMLAVFALERTGFFQMLPVSVTLIGLPETFDTVLFSYMGNAPWA